MMVDGQMSRGVFFACIMNKIKRKLGDCITSSPITQIKASAFFKTLFFSAIEEQELELVAGGLRQNIRGSTPLSVCFFFQTFSSVRRSSVPAKYFFNKVSKVSLHARSSSSPLWNGFVWLCLSHYLHLS
jgi:hypothetical protein